MRTVTRSADAIAARMLGQLRSCDDADILLPLPARDGVLDAVDLLERRGHIELALARAYRHEVCPDRGCTLVDGLALEIELR